MGECEIVISLAREEVKRGINPVQAIKNAQIQFEIALQDALNYEFTESKNSKRKVNKLKAEMNFENNMGLVYKEANKRYLRYKDKNLYDDIVQEGMIGLLKAIETFDNSLGYSFSTYATKCIWTEMYRYVDRKIREKKSHNGFEEVQIVSVDTFEVYSHKDGKNTYLIDTLEYEENYQAIEERDIIDRFLEYCKQNGFYDIAKMKVEGRSGKEISKLLNRSASGINVRYASLVERFARRCESC